MIKALKNYSNSIFFFSFYLIYVFLSSALVELMDIRVLPSPGMTAIPCACLGIFLGGLLVKKLNLSALGAVRMAMLVNLVSTACYVSFLFLGCNTGPVAGVTVAYSNE